LLAVETISFSSLLDSEKFAAEWSKITPERLSTVSCIDLTDQSIDARGAAQIGKCLRNHPNIKTLSVYGNPLTIDGISTILEPLLDGTNTTLTSLDIGHTALDPSAAALLAELVRHNSSITNLSIRGNPIGDEGVATFCDAIAESNRSLRALDIGGIKYNSEGSQAVGRLLAQLESLQTFAMNYNYTLFAESMRHIADGLAQNKSLVTFDMSTTNVKGAGLVLMAQALKHHPTLKNLLISSAHNPNEADGKPASDALADLLKHNRSIEVFECFSNGTRWS
jgi:NLR family CARD domain-containing protein 3